MLLVSRRTRAEVPDREPKMDSGLDRLLTPQEAADIIHVTVSTLLRWAREGRLPSVVMPSGRRRFRLTDLPGFSGSPQSEDGGRAAQPSG
jgi:excisionase family DNA binding protein